MMKNDVVIKDKKVQNEHESIDDQNYNDACKTSLTSFLVVVVEFENLSFSFTHSNVDYHNEERISNSSKAPPNKKFWKKLRKVVNISVTYPSNENETNKEESCTDGSNKYTSYLLKGIPVLIENVNSIPFHYDLGDRNTNPFEENILKSIMDVESGPKGKQNDEKPCTDRPPIKFTNS